MKLSAASCLRPCAGQTLCGDATLILSGPVTMLVVADGLGHGPAAAHAANALLQVAAQCSVASPREVLERATKHLAVTRGAAAMVARFDSAAGVLEVAGVGNIEFRAVSSRPLTPVCTPGILGRPLRPLREFRYSLAIGDLFVLRTDGISRRCALEPLYQLAAQEIADALVRDHGLSTDDAACLVARLEAA